MLYELTSEQLISVTRKWENRSYNYIDEQQYRSGCTKVINQIYQLHAHKEPIVLFFDSPVACLFAASLIYETRDRHLSVNSALSGNFNHIWQQRLMTENNLFIERQLPQFVKAKIENDVKSIFHNANMDGSVDKRIALSRALPQNFPPVSEERDNFLYASDFYYNHLYALKRSVSIYDYENVLEEFIIMYRRDFMTDGMIYTSNNYDWLRASFFSLFVLCDLYIQSGSIKNELIQSTVDLFFKGVFDIYWDHDLCLVSKLPLKVTRNDEGDLHNPDAAAIEFADGFNIYAINGRQIESRIWENVKNNTLTQQDFQEERNVETQAAIYTILGDERMMQLLGAKEIDTQTINHNNGDEEIVSLYKTESTFDFIQSNPFAWVKITCPSTGRSYLIGVEPHHTDALEALASLSPFEREDYSFDFRT